MNLGTFIVMLIVGCLCLYVYFDIGIEGEKANLRKLIKEGIPTEAKYAKVADSFEFNVVVVPVKVKSLKYYFDVNNRQYEGMELVDSLPTNRHVSIKYLKENPEINSINPEMDLDKIQKRSKSTLLFWVSVGMTTFGLLGTVYTIKKMLGK